MRNETRAGSRRLSRPQRARLTVAAGILVGIGAGIGIGNAVFNGSEPTLPSAPTGVIRCANNLPVVGVYIDTGNKNDSAFASWQSGADPSIAAYNTHKSLHIHETGYSIHVGCGGSPQKWEFADYSTSEAVTEEPAGFECEVPPNQNLPKGHGICLQVGTSVLQLSSGS